jgi:hypothetical protein
MVLNTITTGNIMGYWNFNLLEEKVSDEPGRLHPFPLTVIFDQGELLPSELSRYRFSVAGFMLHIYNNAIQV